MVVRQLQVPEGRGAAEGGSTLGGIGAQESTDHLAAGATTLSDQTREGFGRVDDRFQALQQQISSLQEEQRHQARSDNSRAAAAVLKHMAVAALHVAILMCAQLLY